MIIDRIENWELYFKQDSKLQRGIAFILEQHKNLNISDGRYEIIGDEIYAMIQSYYTDKPESKKLESHKKYIDIQYIFDGNEQINWIPIVGLSIDTAYSTEKDVVFYQNDKKLSSLLLSSGYFTVFYPYDAHQPCCMIERPEFVRKIVVKIKI